MEILGFFHLFLFGFPFDRSLKVLKRIFSILNQTCSEQVKSLFLQCCISRLILVRIFLELEICEEGYGLRRKEILQVKQFSQKIVQQTRPIYV